MVATQQPGEDRFQGIYEPDRMDGRDGIDQQMEMVGFAVGFPQLALPLRTESSGDVPRLVEHLARQTAAAILGHQNQVVGKRINAVFTGFECLRWHRN